MSAKDGGSAFPSVEHANEWSEAKEQYVTRHVATGGMKLRDWFAGQALPSLIDAYLAVNGNGCAADHALRNVPALAYKYADAMIAERAKS